MAMPPLRRILLLSAIALVLLIMGTYYLFEWDRIAQLRNAIQDRNAMLREKRKSVRNHRERVDFYKTPEGIEHLARERYNLVLSDERVILLRSPDAPLPEGFQ